MPAVNTECVQGIQSPTSHRRGLFTFLISLIVAVGCLFNPLWLVILLIHNHEPSLSCSPSWPDWMQLHWLDGERERQRERPRGSALTFDLRAVIDLHGLLCCPSACSFNWAANIIQLTPGQCIRSKHKTYKHPTNTNTHSSGPQANVFWPGLWLGYEQTRRSQLDSGWMAMQMAGKWRFTILQFPPPHNIKQKTLLWLFCTPSFPRCGLFFGVCKYFCFKLWTSRLQIHSVCMTIFTLCFFFPNSICFCVC